MRPALTCWNAPVERRVRPEGEYDGWSGKDVLTHLAAYARLIASLLRAEAEGRQATDAELYGRELTAHERALGGLDEVNEAIRRAYEALTYDEVVSLAFPGGPQDESTLYTVAYANPHGHDGTLAKGQSVKVKEGMSFNVGKTSRS